MCDPLNVNASTQPCQDQPEGQDDCTASDSPSSLPKFILEGHEHEYAPWQLEDIRQNTNWLPPLPLGSTERKYHFGLPAMPLRLQRARIYLDAVDPATDPRFKGEPQAEAAYLVVVKFAVDPEQATGLLAEFNSRCPQPASEADLDLYLRYADQYIDPRGLKLFGGTRWRPDDPRLLACYFLGRDYSDWEDVPMEEGDEDTPLKWRYWRDEWWRWDGSKYEPVPDKEMRARVTTSIAESFLNHQRRLLTGLLAQYDREMAEWDAKSGKPRPKCPRTPEVLPVTSTVVNNTMQSLASETLVPFKVEQPSWLREPQKAEPRRYLALANGLLDLDDCFQGYFQLEPHTPKWFSRVCLPYPWDSNATCPRWLDALDLTFAGDADRIALLQEWFGYCLTPSTDLQKFLMLVGEGNNGKSVVCAALTAMLGQANVSHVPLEAFAERFALTSTLGKLANVAAEIGELDRTAEGKLKMFTGGDRMTLDRKNLAPIEATPTARLVLATNNPPRFSDRTSGLWRRLLLVPCDVVIPAAQRVAGMDKCAWWEESGELPGILLWALDGLKRLQQQGRFTAPKACMDALAQHRTESNPARAFLLDHCQSQPGGGVPCDELYGAYRKWCEDNGYRQPLASSQFGKEVVRQFPSVQRKYVGGRGDRFYAYQGIVTDLPTYGGRSPADLADAGVEPQPART